jgi:di/tricarboxylate transporter
VVDRRARDRRRDRAAVRLARGDLAVAGAVLLVALGLLPADAALAAVAKGGDVYLFLTGMMLLSEVARREGLFDWVAAHVVNGARGSPRRLFALVYLVGTVTTVFLSNDATAVVLTPAVFAAARRAKTDPLPLLYVCAFVANAASFVLPISNPRISCCTVRTCPRSAPGSHASRCRPSRRSRAPTRCCARRSVTRCAAIARAICRCPR